MTTAFTPGPWAVDEPGRPWVCTVGNNSSDPAVFGAASPVGEPFVFGDKYADARLIAQAPTMHGLLVTLRGVLAEQATDHVAGERRHIPVEVLVPLCAQIDQVLTDVEGDQ